jgi:hypothetical protein
MVARQPTAGCADVDRGHALALLRCARVGQSDRACVCVCVKTQVECVVINFSKRFVLCLGREVRGWRMGREWRPEPAQLPWLDGKPTGDRRDDDQRAGPRLRGAARFRAACVQRCGGGAARCCAGVMPGTTRLLGACCPLLRRPGTEWRGERPRRHGHGREKQRCPGDIPGERRPAPGKRARHRRP